MSIRVDPMRGSRRINSVKNYPSIAIFRTITVLLVILNGVWAEADLLVRFPIDTPAKEMATVTKQLERSLGLHVLGVNAKPIVAQEEAPAAVPAAASEALEKAKAAYKRLALDEVVTLLDGVEGRCLDQAGYDTCRSLLFDVYMIRGMALMAIDSEAEDADQAFRSAHIVEPTRVLDPKKYPPNVLRRFAKAWTDSKAVTVCRLNSAPDEARFLVDGSPTKERAVALTPGSHVIEARLVGHAPLYRLVNIANITPGSVTPDSVTPDSVTPGNITAGVTAAKPSPLDIRFELTPHSDALVWKTLVGRISDPDWQGQDPEVGQLLSRFDISAVVMLSSPRPTGELSAEIAFADRVGVQHLPSITALAPPLSQTFTDGLKRALDIPVAPPPAATPAIVTGPTDTDFMDEIFDTEDEDEDALDEDEDPSVRFGDTDDLEDTSPKFSTVMKSPWLWISLGLVAAIVGGVVVSTQVD